MNIRTKIIFWICLFGVVDFLVPLPAMAVAGVYVVATRPAWFRKLITDLYRERLTR